MGCCPDVWQSNGVNPGLLDHSSKMACAVLVEDVDGYFVCATYLVGVLVEGVETLVLADGVNQGWMSLVLNKVAWLHLSSHEIAYAVVYLRSCSELAPDTRRTSYRTTLLCHRQQHEGSQNLLEATCEVS